MKHFIGLLIIVFGWLIGLYVGGWMMFAQPIIDACKHFDAGTLNATVIGLTIIKCILAGVVGSVIAGLGMILGSLFFND